MSQTHSEVLLTLTLECALACAGPGSKFGCRGAIYASGTSFEAMMQTASRRSR
jgi:hypothetical protein